MPANLNGGKTYCVIYLFDPGARRWDSASASQSTTIARLRKGLNQVALAFAFQVPSDSQLTRIPRLGRQNTAIPAKTSPVANSLCSARGELAHTWKRLNRKKPRS
jgi:hypothetical protein